MISLADQEAGDAHVEADSARLAQG